MKLSSGKRIGQSGQELVTATIFSFALHILTVAAAVSLYFTTAPRVYVPPFYDVKLVGPIAEVPQVQAPATEIPQTAPKPEPAKQAATKTRTRERKASAKTKKGAMPDLTKARHNRTRAPEAEEEKPARPLHEQQTPTAAPSQGTATPGVNMAVPAGFKPEFQPYVDRLRSKVDANWNPPPGKSEIKATIQFTVLRSGRVGEVKLTESSGNFYFDQAAVRAILASSPFPPLPDGFYKEYELFSVDLMPKE